MLSTAILELSSLATFDDGMLAAAFNDAVRKVVADLDDRPNDDRAREVAIKITFKPIPRHGELDLAKVSAVVTSKMPAQEGRSCTLSPKKLGKDLGLLFSTNGPDVRQSQFEFEGDENES
jgi:hypothetical protein